MFALMGKNQRRQSKTSRKTLARSLDFELMEPRIVLSHKTGHDPPGGGGNGGGGGDPPAAEYSLVDLGALPGNSAGTAHDVNESGWLVGTSWGGVSGTQRAFVLVPQDTDADGELDWYSNASGVDSTNDLMIELTTAPSLSNSTAWAINSDGQVAGT